MNDKAPPQTTKWQPPPRPEWVQRINEEGYCMDISGVVPLDERSLLEAAMRSTGLSEFGAEDWREPFLVLIKSLEEDAELNLMGRLRMRAEIVRLLESRLRVEETYKQHPEIADEEIVQPIIIAGQGRCGSSFLVNMLTANPDNGALLHWEAIFPCPPPEKATYHSDPRIARAHKWVTLWNRVTPTVTSIHEFAGDVSIECCQVLAMNFMSVSWFGILAQANAYEAYMASQDRTLALQYHKRLLKLLQWKNPRAHWVLKENANLFFLPELFKVYPDTCFVWPHRDPVRALASAVSAIGTFQWGGTDHPLKSGVLDYLTDPKVSAAAFGMIIDQIDSGVVPSKQIYHMQYKDLVTDTLPTIEDMYRHFGLKLSEHGRTAMGKYLAANPRDSRPPHKLNITPEAIADARQAYKRYQERFGIVSE